MSESSIVHFGPITQETYLKGRVGHPSQCPIALQMRADDPDIYDVRVGKRTISYRRRSDPAFRYVFTTEAIIPDAVHMEFDDSHGTQSMVGLEFEIDEKYSAMVPIRFRTPGQSLKHRERDKRYRPKRTRRERLMKQRNG